MLSKKTKYAINALLYLLRRQQDGVQLLRAAEIAQQKNIPPKFLENILLELKTAGILGSKAGRGGGYYLRKAPEEVNLADLHRLFDGAIGLLPCVTYQYYEKCEECENEESCGIRQALLTVRNQTVDILKENSLATLLAREQERENQTK